MGSKHYEIYRAHCTTNGIDVHAMTVPDAIKNKPENSQNEQQLITNYHWDKGSLT